MIAFASPANYLKFSIILDEHSRIVAFHSWIRQWFLSPLLFMTLSKRYDLEYFWKKGIVLQEIWL